MASLPFNEESSDRLTQSQPGQNYDGETTVVKEKLR